MFVFIFNLYLYLYLHLYLYLRIYSYSCVLCMHLGNEDLRNAFADEFSEVPELQVAAREGRPKRRTKAEAIASGNKSYMGGKTATLKKEEAFHDVDVYTEKLHYHDKIRDTMYDLAHQFANSIKHIFNFIKNTTTTNKQQFNTKKRTYETMTLGRFPELRKQHKRPNKKQYPQAPWLVSKEVQDAIDDLTATLKVPSCWPALRKPFAHLGHMKSSETILISGDVGAYFFREMDLQDNYKSKFIELLRLIERYICITLLISTSFFIHDIVCKCAVE